MEKGIQIMLKEILFMMFAIVFTMVFGIYTIKLAIRNHNGTHKIERTVEQIDPDYDKKYSKRN
jgi:uncharacterized membrane protein YciS (DUF1049 family)